jgi:Flp pilus assembly protein TadD
VLLDSQNDDVYVSLASVLGQEQKWDDTATAAREALRLNPNYAVAHVDLGVALLKKGDRDGAITEEREALRLNPNNESAHYVLGVALEQSQNRQEAFQEYRAAYELKPQNADYRKAYERLLQQRTDGVQESGNEVPASPSAPTRRLVRVPDRSMIADQSVGLHRQ